MESSPSLSPNIWQAILFDFDGTLADSYSAITASVNHVRNYRGLTPLPEDSVRNFVGRGPHYLLENTVGPDKIEENLAIYRQHHPSVMLTGTHLLPGAINLVTAVKNAGLKIGLCSNKPRSFSEEILVYLGLRDCFQTVLGPEDVAYPKPAPDMLLEALRRLQVAAEKTLYIGDMSVDIQTARGAGVQVWVVPTGSESSASLQLARPDHLLGNLEEALTLLHLP